MSLYTFCVSWTLMPKDTDPGVPKYSSLLFLGAEPPAHVIGPPAGTLLHYACKCNVGISTFSSMLCFDRPRHSCQAALYHGSDMLNLHIWRRYSMPTDKIHTVMCQYIQSICHMVSLCRQRHCKYDMRHKKTWRDIPRSRVV